MQSPLQSIQTESSEIIQRFLETENMSIKTNMCPHSIFSLQVFHFVSVVIGGFTAKLPGE